ncbi:helix-turn-helix domain-containing protein [Streptomyces sp. NPDC102476]|uniref:helix-turn-helix domain-containing protein n=1 Tax=Streptomyces sp. NPDC102476 TaxID=3366181 RepID=UPI00380109B0
MRYRRAMMLLVSAGGNRVPVIAKLVQADEDTVRDVIHRFNEIGLACLDPRWARGRPRLRSPDDEDFVFQTATTRPTKLGQPFTRWSIRELVAYLRKVHGRVIRIGTGGVGFVRLNLATSPEILTEAVRRMTNS